MSEQWTESEREAFFAPGMEDGEEFAVPPEDDGGEYTSLFGAPDFASFIKRDQTAQSKEYEKKVASMLKALSLGSFKNENAVDGATFLYYGPKFARAAGDLTDVSDKAAKAIDLLTAPDTPAFMFAAIAVPFVLQLFRNHQTQVEQVSKSWRQQRKERKAAKARGEQAPRSEGIPLTFKGPFGRKFTFHLPKPSGIFNFFAAQTHDPKDLANEVLSDDKLRRILAKEGIIFVRRGANGNG